MVNVQQPVIHKGLDGVVVDTTAVSLVDGARGELSYRGHEIGALVGRPFAEVAALVATGSFDADFGRRLTDHGTLSTREEALVLALPSRLLDFDEHLLSYQDHQHHYQSHFFLFLILVKILNQINLLYLL